MGDLRSEFTVDRVTEAFRDAVRKAVWEHYAAGHSVVGMGDDGKIYRYYPDGDAIVIYRDNRAIDPIGRLGL